jgi:hypothetical protein
LIVKEIGEFSKFKEENIVFGRRRAVASKINSEEQKKELKANSYKLYENGSCHCDLI